MNWKGSKGKWQHMKHSKGNVEANGRIVANCMSFSTNMDNGEHIEESYINADLIIDAGNTIQQCGKLPSELLKERDELIEIMSRIIYPEKYSDYWRRINRQEAEKLIQKLKSK